MIVSWTKNKLTDIKETIPFISKFLVDNLKENFNEHGQSVLDNLNGALGIAVKLLGRQIIDKYFDNLSEEKLMNFGLGIYFKAACEQAEESLRNIDGISLDLLTRKAIIERFEELFKEQQNSIDNSDLVLHFTPKKHPAVSFIRSVCEATLHQFISEDSKENIINSFSKDFSENISKRVVSAFGDDYETHINEVTEKWTRNKEAILLTDMVELNKIGFAEGEDLKYQETFAYWNKVEEYRSLLSDDDVGEEFEDSLLAIDELIEDYFNRGNDTIEKLLFVIADFGKGKSVFLKQKSSMLARRYQQRGGGTIPIYFNLRDFDTYDQSSSFGVISDFLGRKYGIDVLDSTFQENEYLFLLDSLDECGNLTEERIDKVISSIKKIQNINVKSCRKNRIIITSRPIEHGLHKHLNSNEPYIIKNQESRPINYYISIYGFKKEQFNDSIIDSLKRVIYLNSNDYSGLSKKIIDAITEDKQIDIYQEFNEINLLTPSELRRPIFSYMIYKLILGKADLSTSNKVGIYLSFINVLTKEAKYIDSLKEVNLKDEYRFRNILHATSALWMYETYRGNQGSLKKEDISNTIEGSIIDKSDKNKISKYKDIENVEFISQSYFGQKGDTFYFQHQSFAEILLAEYYLKVFLHYALDESLTPEEARIRLLLGNPTEQTIDFLIGLINLLKESVSNSSNLNDSIIQKRKLLFPMLASLSTSEFSKGLYSQFIKFKWFDICVIDSNTVEPPLEMLKNWIVTDEVIGKIINLATNIIYSKSKYILTTVNSTFTPLYNNELIQINDEITNVPPDIDRWIAFLVGNILYNKERENDFFSSTIKDSKVIFEMFKNWNYFSDNASPVWGRKLFRGLRMDSNGEEGINSFRNFLFRYKDRLSGLDFRYMDFSYAYFENIEMNSCSFISCVFQGTHFVNVFFNMSNLVMADFRYSSLKNTRLDMCSISESNFEKINIDEISLDLCTIAQGVFFPTSLSKKLSNYKGGLLDFGGITYIGSTEELHSSIDEIFNVIKPFIEYSLKKEVTNYKEIMEWFVFKDEKDKVKFNKLLSGRNRKKVKQKQNGLDPRNP